MRCLVFLVALLPLSCWEETRLSINECGVPCYSGDLHTRGIGACRAGRPVCDGAGRLVECLGEVLPAQETCNGADDDCDGRVDESDPAVGVVCGIANVGRCRSGIWACGGGELRCRGGVLPEAEACDGLDNDCNGVVDDVEVTLCYEGPSVTLNNPPCHPGVQLCQDRALVCERQSLPTGEVCDGIDNNCDGRIDEDLPLDPAAQIDVAFVIDRSPSMSAFMPAISSMLVSIGNSHAGDDRFAFAMVDIATHRDSPEPELRFDFASAAALAEAAAVLDTCYSADEGSYDAFWDLATGAIPLGWRPASTRFLVFFGDEQGQTYRAPPRTETEVAALLRASGHRFLGFLRPVHFADYDDLARDTGGAIIELAGPGSMMELVEENIRRCAP